MTEIIAARDAENHEIYVVPTAVDGTVYTKDVIYKVIKEVKAVNGDLDKAAENLVKDRIKLDIVSINERFCSKISE